uniref:Uncharacterized protein n=1 Tax=Meleagris gallopavo TaxID=9103 RepID=A0A803Y5P0_MELGA
MACGGEQTAIVTEGWHGLQLQQGGSACLEAFRTAEMWHCEPPSGAGWKTPPRSSPTLTAVQLPLQIHSNAIEDEGGDPDEIPMASELTNKRLSKRMSKGRKSEEEGVEDNGLEENSRDGQEDIEASLDTLQDIDMMDISVLDEAEIDNSSAVDCGEDYSPDNILDSLSDNKDNVDAEMKELPDQLTENEEDYDEIENNVDSSSDLIEMKKMEKLHLEPGTVKEKHIPVFSTNTF